MKLINLLLCICLLTFLNYFPVSGQKSRNSSGAESQIMLSGLQMNVTQNIEENKNQILEGIRQAAAKGANFLVTPEGSLSGYTNIFDQKRVSDALKDILAKASDLKVGLMLGTCYKEIIKGQEFCYNQVRVYGPDGIYLGAYSKILRCSSMDFPGTGEMVQYVEGQLKTFEWGGIRFGILICNDLWATPGYTTTPNPYLAWKLKQNGAQFIVHCINSGTEQKYRSFHESSAELWASAMKIPIFEVNAAHENQKINAQSGLIDKDGERVLRVPDTGVQFFTDRITIASSDTTQTLMLK